MRTAREVIAESRCKRAQDIWGSGVTMNPGDWLEGADVDIDALRAEGLVIVAAADLRIVIDGEWSKASDAEIVAAFDRARAALAAGGE